MSTIDLDTVKLDGEDGSAATLLVARAEGASRAVLVLPALGIPETYYTPLLTTLRDRGITAAVLGPPRFEAARTRPPSYGYAELALDFVPRALEALDAAPASRFLVGHSLGGAVAGIHAGVADDVAGIALIAAGTPFHEAYDGKARVRTFLGTQLIGTIATLLGFFPGDKLGFGGRMPGKLAKEWSSLARTGKLVARHRSGLDAEAALAAVRCPVLAVVLPKDELAPARAVEHLVGKLGAGARAVHVYVAPEGHASPDHNRWPRDPVPFADILDVFTASVIDGASSAGRAVALPHVAAA